ncbi:MAG: chemotaxis protein CheA, partial [Marinilabiliaceae bacterium]
MTSSLEIFQAKFVEEAYDNIEELEKALIALEQAGKQKDLLEQVFRIMHSLKGGGAMFGFERLSDFAHHMENLYELVRSGSLELTAGILSVTFRSVDLMRSMLAGDTNSASIFELSREIIEEISEIVSGDQCSAGEKNQEENQMDAPDEVKTWYIFFRPGKDTLSNGSNLLYLLDELNNLGSFFSIPRLASVPAFSSLDPEECYFSWDLFLSASASRNEIMDVFLFVESESEIQFHLIAANDMMVSRPFRAHLEQMQKKQTPANLSELMQFSGAESLKKERNMNPGSFSGKEIQPSSHINHSGIKSIRVSGEKIDQLIDLVSEMVITQERLNVIASNHFAPELKMVSENVQKLTTMLRDTTFDMSMVPIELLMTRFQRLVRDLSAQLGKKIQFTVEGGDTELDKSIIDSLADPLLHILRNAIDHGIEDPRERELFGKPQAGSVKVSAAYSGANVVIRITDDGAGIDPEKVKQKAINKGLLSAEKKLSRQEMLELIFLPGFSTIEQVTELSGRGVGMDVVKRNIEAIGGETTVESVLGKGTTVKISIPLVLSIIDGLLVKINETSYVLPLSVVDRMFSISSG